MPNWMPLVVKVNSNAVKEQYCIGTWNVKPMNKGKFDIAKMLFQQHKRWLYTWTSPDGQYQNQVDYILSVKGGEALYS